MWAGGSPELVAWASRVPDLTRVERAVLDALVFFADDQGKVIASRAFLANRVHASPRSVARALKALEAGGILRCIPRVSGNGGTLANLYELLPEQAPVACPSSATAHLEPLASKVNVMSVDLTADVLRACLREIAREGIRCDSAVVLGVALRGDKEFLQRIAWLDITCDYNADPLGLAFSRVWDVLADQEVCARIAEANNPRAYLLECIKNRGLSEAEPPTVIATADLPETGCIGLEAPTGVIDVEDVAALPQTRKVVEDLANAGLDRSFVIAVSRRILQIAARTRPSYRHTEAAKDPWLLALGLEPKVIRAWASVFFGSRRSAVAEDGQVSESVYNRSMTKIVASLIPMAS